jgi:hypothetical protein
MMDTTTAGAKTRKRAPLRRKDESAIRYCLSLDYFYVRRPGAVATSAPITPITRREFP